MGLPYRGVIGLAGWVAAVSLGCNASPTGTESVGDGGSTGANGATDDTSGGTTAATSAATGSTGGDGASDGTEPKYDVHTIPDAPTFPSGPCEDGSDQPLSHIWIANSPEGTISKINTETLEEEGRYATHESFGDPSRTSVNLNGNVAVANRNGGLAKFWANPEHCVDQNGTPGIQTSSGAGDVLAFGEDDCMAWSTAMTCGSNRPAAWTTGVLDEGSCTYQDANFWTVCDQDILLLDGDSGEILETLDIGTDGAFAYGGAADADGNFWIIDFGTFNGGGMGGKGKGSWGTLVRVDYETLDVSHYSLPNSGAYGITVDGEGRPFVCSSTVARFDLENLTWDEATEYSGGGGCMYDGMGRVWHGGYGDGGGGGGATIFGFNTETLELEAELTVPDYTHGISIDAQGHVWGVAGWGSEAYKVDPNNGDVETFSGLNGAYTYSDMTGVGLAGAGGGGTPAG